MRLCKGGVISEGISNLVPSSKKTPNNSSSFFYFVKKDEGQLVGSSFGGWDEIYFTNIFCFETTCSCHFRDLTASAIYVLLYNNLLGEKEKDTKSIVMAGGVAGTTFLSISDKYLSDPALILYCKFCPSSFYHFNLHSIAKYFVTTDWHFQQQVSTIKSRVLTCLV